MRRIIMIALLGLAAVGCARKAPKPVGAESAPAPAPVGAAAENPDDPANGGGPVYEGRTVRQWDHQLQSSDHAVRQQASVALSALGERGYPSLRDGMLSKSDEVRVACLQAITKPALLEHGNEMIPLLTRMLRDREPMVRRSAAARLCWFGSGAKGALRDLQEMADRDPLPDIRQVARVSIELIQNPNAPPNRGVEPMPGR